MYRRFDDETELWADMCDPGCVIKMWVNFREQCGLRIKMIWLTIFDATIGRRFNFKYFYVRPEIAPSDWLETDIDGDLRYKLDCDSSNFANLERLANSATSEE